MFAGQRVPVIDIRTPLQAVISCHFNGCGRIFDTVGAGRLNKSVYSGRVLHRIPRATIMIRLSVKTLSLWLAAAASLSFGSITNAEAIQWVTVGDPGEHGWIK
jgi:hypothetical protein